MSGSLLKLSLAIAALILGVAAQGDRPIVPRPQSTRAYKTVLSMDGGGFRVLTSTMVVIEIEAAIKRYLVAHPEFLPDGVTSEDEFDILLADYFDAMSGVSAGSWATGYLASKGGNGAAAAVFSDRRINRRHGDIIPGGAKGLEVFFIEFANTFYGDVAFNITPPTIPPNLLASNLTTIAGLAQAGSLAELAPGIEIPGVNSAFFEVEGLEDTLELFLGDVKLSELSTYFVCHAYDLIRRQTIFFVHDTTPRRRALQFTAFPNTRTRPRRFPNLDDVEETGYEPDLNVTNLDFYMKDVVRGSSAIPAFHEAKNMSPVDMPDLKYSLIDGAIITNNVALQSLIFLSSAPRRIPVEELAMISLGSGIPLLDLGGRVNGAALGWLLNNELMTILTDGSAENIQTQVDFLFYGNPAVRPGQYLRIQTYADADTPEGEALASLPDVENLAIFRRLGTQTARRYRRSIESFVENFIFA